MSSRKCPGRGGCSPSGVDTPSPCAVSETSHLSSPTRRTQAACCKSATIPLSPSDRGGPPFGARYDAFASSDSVGLGMESPEWTSMAGTRSVVPRLWALPDSVKQERYEAAVVKRQAKKGSESGVGGAVQGKAAQPEVGSCAP